MSPKTVTIVDTGGANLNSIQFAFERIGVMSQVTSDAATIAGATHLILPGVGAAGVAMKKIKRTGLGIAIRQSVLERGTPTLGICLGMQLYYAHSEEDDVALLGILPGVVKRIESRPDMPVPHMGWNRVERVGSSRLLNGIEDGSHFYFVHSYAVSVSEFPGHVTGAVNYGAHYAAVVESNSFFGVQFHPERSGAAGEKLLKNFLEIS